MPRSAIGRPACRTSRRRCANVVTPITIEDMKRLISEARRLMPEVGIQVPPEPHADWWPELVAAGATDLGGLSSNGDHISPEHPFPSPHQVRKRLQADGVAWLERLCVYAKYIDADWVAQGVLDVIKTRFWSFIPRRGSGRTDAPRPIRPDLVADAVRKGRDGAWLTPEELTALFAETRPEAIEDLRQAADELRAELAGETVTFVVNRNINVSNVCIVGCAFCGFGQGKRSRTPTSTMKRSSWRGSTRPSRTGQRSCASSREFTPTGRSRTTSATCASRRPPRRSCICTPTRRWRSRTSATCPACHPARVFAQLREAGLGSTPDGSRGAA